MNKLSHTQTSVPDEAKLPKERHEEAFRIWGDLKHGQGKIIVVPSFEISQSNFLCIAFLYRFLQNLGVENDPKEI